MYVLLCIRVWWPHTYTGTQGWSEAHRASTGPRQWSEAGALLWAVPQREVGFCLQHPSRGRKGSLHPTIVHPTTPPVAAAQALALKPARRLPRLFVQTKLKNLNFTKYAVQQQQKKNENKQKNKSQKWLPLYSQYSILLLGHLTKAKVPKDGRGKGLSKVEPQLSRWAYQRQRLLLARAPSSPRQAPCAFILCAVPKLESV